MDILFCEGSKRKTTTLRAEAVKDLALEEIIESIASNEKNNAIIKNIFTRIPEDISDIRYRQEILKDFCENEELCEQVSDSLGLITTLRSEADQNTLILFNETYSTTSAVDGLYLSKDLLHILKKMGTSVIFNTHIHEVARSIEEMNDWEGESRVVSLVMEIRDNQNTFKIKRSAPDSKSYAQNIAKKYGITFDQMVEMRDPTNAQILHL